MRIVDRQKDYYDGVMAMGMDLSLPYIRERRVAAIEMSNDENAARLGHGGKYSFRKPPSKK